jgi:hypothetical protein
MSKIDKLGFTGDYYQLRQKLPLDQLRELCSRGVPIAQIATLTGVAETTVHNWLAKHDIYHPRIVGRPKGS